MNLDRRGKMEMEHAGRRKTQDAVVECCAEKFVGAQGRWLERRWDDDAESSPTVSDWERSCWRERQRRGAARSFSGGFRLATGKHQRRREREVGG
jgi:hypothetical protein